MFPRAARVFVGAEVVLGVLYFLLDPSGLRAAVFTAVSLGMVVAVVVGARRWRPSVPMAWYLIAGGQLLFSIGDAISFYREWVLGSEVPFPSVADGFYLAFYLMLTAALLLLVRGRAPGRDLASLIDATIITTGIGMLSWVFLIGPYVRLPDLSLPQRLVSIAYPLGDLMLLAVAVRLWRAGGTGGALASRLLAVGLLALLAADAVFGLSLLNDSLQVGGPLDAVYMAYYVALGLAALHPSMVSLSEPAQVSTRLTRTRLGLLAGASLMAPAMLVIQSVRHQPIDVAVIAGGSVVLFLLALARMGGLASEVASQTERKRAMQTVLRATEQERVRLAADLHDGPVQELTALRYGLTRARTRIQRGQPEQAESLLAELEDELASGITGLRRLDRPGEPARPRPRDGPVPGHPGDAQQRGQARRRLPGHGVAGRRERLGAAAHQRRRRRLRPGRGRQAAQRGPLRPGRHARAGRDGRWPPQHRQRSRQRDHGRRGDGEPAGRARLAPSGPPGRQHHVADAVGAAVLGQEGEGAGGQDASADSSDS